MFLTILGMAGFLGVRHRLERGFAPASLDLPSCRIIQDSSGELLYFAPDARGERHRAVSLQEIPPLLQAAFLVAEDERFHEHAGVDLLAVLRALRDNHRAGRVVSGASTITMQLVRCNSDRERSLGAKVRETVQALIVERRLDKDQILERYLNSVPMGRNIRGVALAAECYFDLPLAELSAAQCATLAALPKAPGTLDPVGGDLERLRQRRLWIIDRLVDSGMLTTQVAAAARWEQIAACRPVFPMQATHFCQRVLSNPEEFSGWYRSGGNQVLSTTLDAGLQENAEFLLRSHRERVRRLGASQAALLLVRNHDRAVLATVGSFEWAAGEGGFNDGTRAARSSGSTLKPFLYALALDSGYDPAAFLEDLEQSYRTPGGEYRPRNAGGESFGPVGMRTAMGSSMNLTAIRLVRDLGNDRFLEHLDRCRLPARSSADAGHYGLGLAVGNLEVTLEGLVSAYAMLAAGGLSAPLRYSVESMPGDARRVLSEEASWIISDMLADPSARTLGFGRTPLANAPVPVAIKTGTSTYSRDAWILGYTPQYTIGIWSGNFDGSSAAGLGGMDACEPILGDLLRSLYGATSPAAFPPPAGVERQEVCAYSGHEPSEHCPSVRHEWFLRVNPSRSVCSFHGEQGRRHELPAPFAAWVDDRGTGVDESAWKLANAGRFPGRGRDEIHGAGIQITYPLRNDRFRLAATGEQYRVPLRVRLDRPLPWVRWFVDGVELARVGPPYETEWTLQRGEHRISVSGPDQRGVELTLFVD